MAGQGSCATGAAGCIAAEQAHAFIAGRLMPAERAMVEHRIAACPGCRAVVAAAREPHGGTAMQRPAVATVPSPAPPVDRQARPANARVDPLMATAPLRPNYRPAREGDRSAGRPIDGMGGRPGDRADDRPGTRMVGRSVDPAVDPAIDPARDRPGDTDVDRASHRAVDRTAVDGELATGEIVGRYVVERPLGAGGMGVVSLARDPELRRAVVIKLVHPNMGHGEGGDELEARLRREAQAMAQVSHTNVVQIFDIGRRGDRVFLAMEYIAGRTLDVWLIEQPRTHDEILGVIRQAAAGLAAAHRAGLVHRDFKPSNVLVSHDGVVKVTDFGLARSFAGGPVAATRQLRVPSPGELAHGAAQASVDPFAQAQGPGVQAPRPSGVHAVLTEANSVVGTPAYMAPEQAAGRRIDARTDQYALAVTLLDALLAQPPTRRAIAPGAPPAKLDAALERAGVAPGVRGAVIRALAEDPAARFATIDDLLRALAPPPVAQRRSGGTGRAGWIAAAIGVAAIAGGAVWFTAARDAPVAGCTAEAPGRWTGAPRARVVAALSSGGRPFASWEAARVAGAIDAAVESIGAAEVARCRGTPLEGSAGSDECIARRGSAFAAAFAALSASPPPVDAWRWVRPIEQCDARVAAGTTALRDELTASHPARAREIAEAARTAGDDALAGDALELAGLGALERGDAVAADADFQAMRSVGERTGDDAVRGRALLRMLEVARWRGDHALARRELDELHAMLARHGDAPRDRLAVAQVAGPAFSDLGDVATAFAAWDQARAAAAAVGDRDAALIAAARRAWSTYALRFDLAGARREVQAALSARGASRGVRAEALSIAADLAIAARDGAAAQAVLAEEYQLFPELLQQPVYQLRIQRARALAGEIEKVLARLVPSEVDDALTAARIGAARGKVLLAADRPGEARIALEQAGRDVRGVGRRSGPAAMAVPERIDVELTTCEAQIADLKSCRATYLVEGMLKLLHPRAPARARLAIAQAAGDFVQNLRGVRTQYLTTALDILVEAGAEPVRIAELRWEIAQLGAAGLDHAGLARTAREAFQTGGRTAEVAAIDAWLAERPAAPPPAASTREPPAKRDPWGPQP